MKNVFYVLMLVNCAATRDYLENRMQDSGDIFHVGIEKDVYGVSVFIDSVGLGIQHSTYGQGIGIRYGTIGLYKTGGKKIILKTLMLRRTDPCIANKNCFEIYGIWNTTEYAYGNSSFTINTNYHEPVYLTSRNKSKNVSVSFTLRLGSSRQYEIVYDTDPKEDNRGDYTILPIEISAGMYLGIRLGFNFSEFADFLVGFIGFDPLGDDIAGIPQPAMLDKNWEDQMDNLDEIIRPIPVIEKSKYFKAKSDDIHHCNIDDVCYNYERKEFKIKDQENECKQRGGLFLIQSKCQQINIVGFCQFSDFEKVYNDYSIWSIKSAEKDCKNLKGTFVR